MSTDSPHESRAAAVREMFDRIAPRYDRMNRLLTLGNDQRWRRALVRRLGIGPGDRVLDLACGTGDFVALCQELGADVVGLDFSRGMLDAADAVLRPALVQGDALRLPFADGVFTAAVSGFALRNFAAIPPVLGELARVLQPGGRLGLLEVDTPPNRLVAAGHRLYFRHAVPLAGRLFADGRAYRYLPESTVYLPGQDELVRMLVVAGFRRIAKRRPMLGAIQAVTAVRT